MPERNSRRTAAFIVARWLASGEYPSAMLPDGANRAFVQDLVYTVIRRLRALRFAVSGLVAKMPKGEIEALLLVGAAQILYMPDVAEYAAVSETVDAAKLTRKSVAGLVNGVLRNLIRRKAEIVSKINSQSLDVRESFPQLLVRRWIERYGKENAERLCAFYNTPAETFLAWRDGRFERLDRGVRVETVTGFSNGEFVVQDPATAGAVELLDVSLGDRVIDVCAAPGGKTIQIAWRLKSTGKLVACEVNSVRRARLEENLKRCRITGVEVADKIPERSQYGEFDKVLVDVPCSNTGVLRRRADARWNWNQKKLSELVRLQSEILEKASKLVSLGGILVYSTCSLENEENEDQVKAFLARHPDFRMTDSRKSIPFETLHDGAFACALRRDAVGGTKEEGR